MTKDWVYICKCENPVESQSNDLMFLKLYHRLINQQLTELKLGHGYLETTRAP